MAPAVGILLFVIGIPMCLLNIYLSFVRFPLCRFLGWECKNVSGIPLLPLLRDLPIPFWIGLTVAILDTGGLHWFVGVMLWHHFRQR